MFFMVGNVSFVRCERIEPDLSRRGQYLQPLLVQKGKPLNLWGVPLGLLPTEWGARSGLEEEPEIGSFTVVPEFEGFTVTPKFGALTEGPVLG